MAFPSPRPVRSSSSKSLRTSLTSFPRPFCSFHVFRMCNLPFLPSPLTLPSPAVGRSTPEVAPLNRSVQIQSRVQWILSSSSSSLSSSFVRGLSNLGFGTQREPPRGWLVRFHQHIQRYLAIQQGVAKSEVTSRLSGRVLLSSEITVSN